MCAYVLCMCLSLGIQAIDELKASLFESGVEYTENTLVVVEDDIVEGLSRNTFVSFLWVTLER